MYLKNAYGIGLLLAFFGPLFSVESIAAVCNGLEARKENGLRHNFQLSCLNS